MATPHAPLPSRARFSRLRRAMEVDNSSTSITREMSIDSGVEDRPERRSRRLVANRAIGAIKTTHAADRTVIRVTAAKLTDLAAWVVLIAPLDRKSTRLNS